MPKVVHGYNQHIKVSKCRLDQIVSRYSFLYKSVKWWRRVFLWVLEVAVINSYIIYMQQTASREQRPMKHYVFRRELIKHLSAPLQSQTTQMAHTNNLKQVQHVFHFLKRGRKLTKCIMCSNRVPKGMTHLTIYHKASSLPVTMLWSLLHTNFHT